MFLLVLCLVDEKRKEKTKSGGKQYLVGISSPILSLPVMENVDAYGKRYHGNV
jgi:hypothetical protein